MGITDNDIIELLDENDHIIKFEHIITIDHNQNTYVFLTPIEVVEEDHADEIVIFKIGKDKIGNNVLIGIDDESESEEVYESYLQIMEQNESEGED